MSGQHTQGRLEAYGLVIRGDVDTSEDQVAAATYSAADARRLAACWNACEGVSTESIESLAAVGGVSVADAAMKQAYAAATELQQLIEEELGESGAGLLRMQRERDQLRAELDAAAKRNDDFIAHGAAKAMDLAEARIELDAARALLGDVANWIDNTHKQVIEQMPVEQRMAPALLSGRIRAILVSVQPARVRA